MSVPAVARREPTSSAAVSAVTSTTIRQTTTTTTPGQDRDDVDDDVDEQISLLLGRRQLQQHDGPWPPPVQSWSRLATLLDILYIADAVEDDIQRNGLVDPVAVRRLFIFRISFGTPSTYKPG